MSEDRDEALLQSLFADAARAPMGDETFVQGVMGRVSDHTARTQARVTTLAWAGGAVAAFLAATNFTAIVAEISKAFADVNLSGVPALGGGASVLLLVAAVAGGAYLFSDRA